MMTTKRFARTRSARHRERGFSLIEVMIAAAILVIGLVSMLAVFGVCVAATQDAQADMIAKQEATAAIESIFTARNTAQINFNPQINNVSNAGIFLDGPQQLLSPGPDGLVGTADDTPDPNAACPGPAKCLVMPGPDGIAGTADDVVLPLNNFSRTILIQPVALPGNQGNNPNLKQITVTVSYRTLNLRNVNKNYVMSAFISSYR
ncbi:MAG TPA: prepilin-type N-terminal cleavage/methylation domain-containing protein [Terriglobales bacterium]|nr:prepilin-type N-terminal cleavage/methylation domain-containing protein [Terriglobales bacterium]